MGSREYRKRDGCDGEQHESPLYGREPGLHGSTLIRATTARHNPADGFFAIRARGEFGHLFRLRSAHGLNPSRARAAECTRVFVRTADRSLDKTLENVFPRSCIARGRRCCQCIRRPVMGGKRADSRLIEVRRAHFSHPLRAGFCEGSARSMCHSEVQAPTPAHAASSRHYERAEAWVSSHLQRPMSRDV